MVEAALGFICLYLMVVFLSTLLLAGFGMDLMSAFSGSVAAMGNVGPGFATVSSLGNFSQVPIAGKWVLSIVMLIGRLEIYSLFMFFFQRFNQR